MGAGQSNASQGAATGRTVTVENDIPVGVVNLSDEVVQRLKGQHVRNLEAARAADVGIPAAGATSAANAGTIAAQVARPGGAVYYGEQTATAVEVRRQKDGELRANDAYWTKRLAQQEQAQLKGNAVREDEFNAALEDVRSRFQNAPPQHQPAPCREFKQRLVECLRSHPDETLHCTPLVEQFTHCVSAHRAQLLDAKHAKPATAVQATTPQPVLAAA